MQMNPSSSDHKRLREEMLMSRTVPCFHVRQSHSLALFVAVTMAQGGRFTACHRARHPTSKVACPTTVTVTVDEKRNKRS